MLKELVAAAERFRQEGKLGPPAYEPKGVNWIIELREGAEPALQGPYRKDDLKRVVVPSRQRSGKIGPENLKPYLLADDARYALGIAEPGKDAEARLAHQGFVAVLRQATEATADADLRRVVSFLEQPLPDEIRKRVEARDSVTFRCGTGLLPIEKPEVQRFWANYLASELLAGVTAPCAVCGCSRPILQTLPVPITILGQRCQITSFNNSAFTSFGKEQTTNSPLCYECAMSATQALQHMTAERRHHATLARDERQGRGNPLRNQLAAFWLKTPESPVLDEDGVEIDLEAAYSAPARPAEDGVPPPELGQLERLVRIPFTGQAAALRLQTNTFYLAVLSANKGRLVVREWISVSLGDLRDRLGAYVAAARLVALAGDEARVLPIPALTEATAPDDPGLGRALIRTAYLGARPPEELLEAAVLRFRVPAKATKRRNEIEAQEQRRHALGAAMKLVLTYGREEAETLVKLDPERGDPARGDLTLGDKAYLCGRLLAVIEEIQWRSQRSPGSRTNASVADRFYGAASTTPAATLALLIKLAKTAYLPKLRREGGGYDAMQELLESVLGKLRHEEGQEGFPSILKLRDQAEFALGFYHQRAAFRASREAARQAREANQSQVTNYSQTGGSQ